MQKLKQQQLFDRVFDRLPDHVTLLLIIISGFLLARLTWMMFPSDPSITAPLASEQTDSSGVSVMQAHATSKNLGKEIASYHLLGVYKAPQAAPPPEPVKQVAAPKPAPKPREPLALVGVYSLSEKEGVAIIDVKGKQEVVGIGEPIGETTATLKRVYANRIDVSWEGEVATYTMPNIDRSALGAMQIPEDQQLQPEPMVQPASFDQPVDYQSDGSPDPAAQTVNDGVDIMPEEPPQMDSEDGEHSGAVSVQPLAGALAPGGSGNEAQAGVAAKKSAAPTSLAAFKQEIINNNINLLQVLRPSPRRENGQLIGFAVKPGTNRALFNQTGLKSGDVVTAINGMPLNNNAASRQAMQGLVNASSASLTVLRGGQEQMLQIAF